MKRKESYLVLSYFPLLVGDPTKVIDMKNISAFEELQKSLSSYEELGNASACLWCRYESRIVPVFAMKKARQIAEHIRFWSQESGVGSGIDHGPSSWFKLAVVKEGGRFSLLLFPNIELSIKRFKTLHGLPADLGEDKLVVLFKPLVFISNGPGMLSKAKFVKESYVGFIDPDEAFIGDPKNPQLNPDAQDPVFLGPFPVVFDDPAVMPYAKGMFDDNK